MERKYSGWSLGLRSWRSEETEYGLCLWMVRLYRGQKRISHCKYNAQQPWVFWFLPLLKESVVLLSEAAVWWESSLLQCSDVDIEPLRSKGFPLSFKHVIKQADCGESAPYWLEGAQLEAGGSWPVGRDDPSHRRRQPVAHGPTPVGLDVWPVTAASRVGKTGMPSRQDPPLGLTDVVQRRAEQNIWHQLDYRSCWQVIMFTMNRLRGSSPDFCRVYSLAFPPPRYSTRQRSHTPMAGARMLEP